MTGSGTGVAGSAGPALAGPGRYWLLSRRHP